MTFPIQKWNHFFSGGGGGKGREREDRVRERGGGESQREKVLVIIIRSRACEKGKADSDMGKHIDKQTHSQADKKTETQM